MNMLKEKHEIPNYEEKAKVLRENGWEPWYSADSWVKTEWYDQGKRIDMAGRCTEDVYNSIIEKNMENKMNKWEDFAKTLLSSEQVEYVNKYSEISNTKPKQILVKENEILVSFGPKIYSLNKQQILKLSEIDFIEYKMDVYGVSIITFGRN